jgi:prepilin-type N-terminal cleavage/methylation domain-containing protein
MRGFTVLEMVVVTLILAVFLTGLLFIFSVSNQSWSGGSTVIDLRQEIIRAMMTMDKELRLTNHKTFPLSIGVPSASVTFRLPTVDASGHIILDASGNIVWSNPITYSLNAASVLVRTFGAGTSVLANNILTIQFTRITNRQVQIDITARKPDNRGRLFQDTERTIIKMRN